MIAFKQRLKSFLFRLLGKDPEAVVVSFCSGEAVLARAMVEEALRLTPGRRHYVVSVGEAGFLMPAGATLVSLEPGSAASLWRQLRRALGRVRIGLAPVLFTSERPHAPLRWAAFLTAPRKILAYNRSGERHHLKLASAIASLLFLRGVPLDRVWLRPRWLWPWRRDKSVFAANFQEIEGRPLSPARRRIGVLSPHFPYPLSHGGAVRIFHLLREMAREFDVFLFAFDERAPVEEAGPVMEFCARAIVVGNARYREPRWATLRPPEVCEFRSEVMRRELERVRREYALELLQVEYTHLAGYGGDILVEHDVTFDLHRQVFERERRLAAWWDWWRWRRFERRAARAFHRVVVMSEKDAFILGAPRTRVIENGVDLARFHPAPEPPGENLLFVGSFRHFPNITAYRFFTEQVWPRLRERFPAMTLTVVAGPDPLTYWRQRTATAAPERDERIRLLDFVRDVRPLYVEANLAIVPTLVSAGTNLKVLEAMAMERAVVSTPSGCAGLGLVHGESIWIASSAAEFAEGVARLIEDAGLRRSLARAARAEAERRFAWERLGEKQRAVIGELLGPRFHLRAATCEDLGDIARIQDAAPEAAHWEPERYLSYDIEVAVACGRVAAFLVCRRTAEREYEILNLAVDPGFRRQGVARALLESALARHPGEIFLEVRASNATAQELYRRLGFSEAGRRPAYYNDPVEAAVVMRRQSC